MLACMTLRVSLRGGGGYRIESRDSRLKRNLVPYLSCDLDTWHVLYLR